ncbi:uncharacterized protein LOC133023752 [Limanda limanda]|uniref:uncharacterized protein LOC133023752 n=1 Tax=Limanda limanda TaxID=27771 RepID=UPI0029C92251|nr:uncharacterized protein LOC133023752 [Limanda limanda]
MDSWTALALLYYFLFAVVVESVPVSHPPVELREAAERAKALVEKILRDLPPAHAATVSTEGLTLDPSPQTPNLQMMVTSLGIPPAPVLKPLSDRFTKDMCVSRMSVGCRLYQGLLGVLSDRLGGLTNLRADLSDLLTHINKMKEAAPLGAEGPEQTWGRDLASRLTGNYEVQVAAHVTLTQLRSFCHDLIRSLRAIATYRRRAAGAP